MSSGVAPPTLGAQVTAARAQFERCLGSSTSKLTITITVKPAVGTPTVTLAGDASATAASTRSCVEAVVKRLRLGASAGTTVLTLTK